MGRGSCWLCGALLLLALLAPVFPAAAAERKDEWREHGYGFGGLKLVLLAPVFGAEVEADELQRRIIADKLQELFVADPERRFAAAGLRFLSEAQLRQKLAANSGEDMEALAQRDPGRYAQRLREAASFYCGGVLEVKLVAYGETRERVPEHIETQEVNKEVHIVKRVTAKNGEHFTIDEWVTVPVTEARVVPAHDVVTAHAGLACTLTDTRRGEAVWELVDIREAAGKDRDGMLQRILKRTAEHVEALKK